MIRTAGLDRVMCGIITMVYIDKNHKYDFKSGNHVWNHSYALY